MVDVVEPTDLVQAVEGASKTTLSKVTIINP